MKGILKPKFDKLQNKTEFIERLAAKVDRSPATLQNHWFTRYWRVPAEFLPLVQSELNKALILQTPKEATAAYEPL